MGPGSTRQRSLSSYKLAATLFGFSSPKKRHWGLQHPKELGNVPTMLPQVSLPPARRKPEFLTLFILLEGAKYTEK